jgi:hypothetical protein
MKSEQIEKIVDLAANLAAKADDIDQVLIIYRYKDDGGDDRMGSMDNGLRLHESLWLAAGFQFWLQAGAMGLLPKKGDD